MRRHVVLIGLPGAGKTVVGRRVAKRLTAPFVDIDQAVERDAGISVREIFATRGEAVFRELERAAMRRTADSEACIVSPGGGWAAQPGNLASVSGRALVVWLEVDPQVAVTRVGRASGTRPLLDTPDPLGRMQALLEERITAYRQADVTVDTSALSADQVADRIVELARSLAGW